MHPTIPQMWVKADHLSEYQQKKQNERLAIAQLMRQVNLSRPASLIEKCGSNETSDFCECGNSLTRTSYRCRHPLCPNCRRSKGFKVSRQIEDIVEIIQSNTPGLKMLFLTLTIPSCDEEQLQATLSNLSKDFTRLINRAELKKYLVGSFRGIEIGYNRRTQMFQPHIHALLAVKASYFSKGYLSEARLLELWREATNCPVITGVRSIRLKPNQENGETLATVAAEKVRYIMKPLAIFEWTSSSIKALNRAIHKRRLYEFQGDLRFAKRMLSQFQRVCLCTDCLSRHSSEETEKDTTQLNCEVV
jgi:plasmid rolling circle replication initiator protein Rep